MAEDQDKGIEPIEHEEAKFDAGEADVEAALPESIDLTVVNMDRVIFEGKVKSLMAPVKFGNLAILPGHTPLYTKLDKGKLIVNTINKQTKQEIEIEGGIAKVTQYKTVILVGF